MFLDALEKLRKATIDLLCLSVCPSAWNNSATAGWIFAKFDISVFFENSTRKFKFRYSLKRVAGTLEREPYTFLMTSRWSLLRMWNVPRQIVEKIKTHILCSIYFPPKRDMWKKYDTAGQTIDENIIRRMCFAYWTTKATGKFKIYNTHCFTRAKRNVARMRLEVTFVPILTLCLYKR
jgi:hypothetical protein